MDTLDEKRAPDALHVALDQGLAERGDGLDRERAVAILIETAELVLVQAANGTQFKSEASG